MPIRDTRQFWSGVLFLGIGLMALWLLPRPIGTLAAMGPGYFPMLLGIGLLLLGFAAVILGLFAHAEHRVGRLPIQPTCFVLGGVLAVGFLLTDWGLALSLVVLVAASCYSRLFKRPLEVLVIYLVLLVLTWVIFIYAIQLPITLL